MSRYIRVRSNPIEQIKEHSKTVLGRFTNFFEDVPTWSGQEWETVAPAEIADFFKDEVIPAFQEYHEQVRKNSVDEFNNRNWLVRFWMKKKGWKEHEVPTADDLKKSIIGRCRRLADWMQDNQYRPFYEGSDMSAYIHNPRAVADILSK